MRRTISACPIIGADVINACLLYRSLPSAITSDLVIGARAVTRTVHDSAPRRTYLFAKREVFLALKKE